MQDEPTPSELIAAVADFLRTDIAPQLTGHAGFKLRVAINALDLVTRQLTLSGDSDAAELHRLTQLLGLQGSLDQLNRELAERIRSGAGGTRHAGPCRASVADHACQAGGRPADLRELSAGD